MTHHSEIVTVARAIVEAQSTIESQIARLRDITGPASEAASVSVPSIPTVPGTAFGGGFYAGQIRINDQAFALIVAPKDNGELSSIRWKTSRTNTPMARSLHDGHANSVAMHDEDHPAAKFCRDLRIGGFDDWFLPSRSELNLLCEVFMSTPGGNPEQTTAEAFKQGGPEAFAGEWYWSSTEFSANSAWMQLFGGGYQDYGGKLSSCRCRAVRKVLI